MLRIDLNRLRQEGRARIDADIETSADFWKDMDLSPTAPLEVRLEAQQAGQDVVVRGTVAGVFGLECRRCLEPVDVEVHEELGRLYRPPEDLGEDEPEDVVALPPGVKLDVTDEVREQLLLAVPRFATCGEECRGLCPVCGTNRNESSCECSVEEEDERWAPLRRLKTDG